MTDRATLPDNVVKGLLRLRADWRGQGVEELGTALVTLQANSLTPGETISASAIGFAPGGGVSADTIQEAVEELDADKSPVGHGHILDDITGLVTALASKVQDDATWPAGQVIVTPGGTISASNLAAALTELDAEKSPVGHTHVATLIGVTPVGGIAATNVQAALAELDSEKSPVGHGHPASAITVTPTGAIASTNVQAALAELDLEKAPLVHGHSASDVTGLTTLVAAQVDAAVPDASFASALAGAVPSTLRDRDIDMVSVRRFGAIADGASHPISGTFLTRGTIQDLRVLLPTGAGTLSDGKASRIPATKTIGGLYVSYGSEWAHISYNCTAGSLACTVDSQSAGDVFRVSTGGYANGQGTAGKINVSPADIGGVGYVYLSNRLGSRQIFSYSDIQTTDENDWVAWMLAIRASRYVWAPDGTYITNRPIPLRDGLHIELSRAAVVQNTRDPNGRFADDFLADVFQAGNLHPQVHNEDPVYDDLRWAKYPLNATANAGVRSMTVTTPGGVVAGDIVVGDIVVIRSSNGPYITGATGYIYDFNMFNRVKGWNAGTGVIDFEYPIPVVLLASGTSTQLTGPVLCVNRCAAFTNFTGKDWSILKDCTVRGGTLIGLAPLSTLTAAYNCVFAFESHCQHMASIQAFSNCRVEITGSGSKRIIEMKMFSNNVRGWVRGYYRFVSGVTPVTLCSFGEQSFDIDMELDAYAGRDFTPNLRLVEIYSPGIRLRGRWEYYGSGGHTEIYQIKSTDHLARPPRSNALDVIVRGEGLTQYGLVGSTTTNQADPVDTYQRVNGRGASAAGVVPSFGIRYNRGTSSKEEVTGDQVVCSLTNPAEMPDGGTAILTTIAGAVTYAANTQTKVGTTFSLLGMKSGDKVLASLQLITAPTSGSFGDLTASLNISTANVVVLYIHNRSATDVVFPAGTVLWVRVSYKRERV